MQPKNTINLNQLSLDQTLKSPLKTWLKKIKKLTGFGKNLTWERFKPDGQPQRKLDVSKAKKEFKFVVKTGFDTGLKNTIN